MSRWIGPVRRYLLIPWDARWNAWIRDLTGKLELFLSGRKGQQTEEKTHRIHNDGSEHYCPVCKPHDPWAGQSQGDSL